MISNYEFHGDEDELLGQYNADVEAYDEEHADDFHDENGWING